MVERILNLNKKAGLFLIFIFYLISFTLNTYVLKTYFPGFYVFPVVLAILIYSRKTSFYLMILTFIIAFLNSLNFGFQTANLTRVINLIGVVLLFFYIGTELKKHVENLKEKNEACSILSEEILLAFAQTIEAKDPYITGHSNNVSFYAVKIAEEMGLNQNEIEEIYWAGILHDIGKIGVSENILNKEGPLNNEEWEAMKKHPEIGAEIIRQIPSLKKIVPYILYHHNYYNGGGYPGNLKGDKIPLGARILAVADSFDAMTSDRVYRKAMTFEEAKKEIVRCTGTQFDPKVTRAFLNYIEKNQKIKIPKLFKRIGFSG